MVFPSSLHLPVVPQLVASIVLVLFLFELLSFKSAVKTHSRNNIHFDCTLTARVFVYLSVCVWPCLATCVCICLCQGAGGGDLPLGNAVGGAEGTGSAGDADSARFHSHSFKTTKNGPRHGPFDSPLFPP